MGQMEKIAGEKKIFSSVRVKLRNRQDRESVNDFLRTYLARRQVHRYTVGGGKAQRRRSVGGICRLLAFVALFSDFVAHRKITSLVCVQPTVKNLDTYNSYVENTDAVKLGSP